MLADRVVIEQFSAYIYYFPQNENVPNMTLYKCPGFNHAQNHVCMRAGTKKEGKCP